MLMKIQEKRQIVRLLQTEDLDDILGELRKFAATKVINPLFAGLCNGNELIRWHAITAMGVIVSDIAAREMEAARIVMRRLMWSLNDESGGIGWGAPEAMAEIMASQAEIASEYAHILVSYMREDGNFLEHETLQRGVLWGVARLTQSRPDLMRSWQATRYTLPYLDSQDPIDRGLAAWALGLLHAQEAVNEIKNLIDDPQEIRLYWDRSFTTTSIGRLATQALSYIQS